MHPVANQKGHQSLEVDNGFLSSNKIDAPYGKLLGLMKCFPNNSWSWEDNSSISGDAMRYGTLVIGAVPGDQIDLELQLQFWRHTGQII